MLIQHILTEEIFAKVFDDSEFHQHNNVARELYALEGAFFTGALKKQTLKGLETYYAAIRAAAAQISCHGEKQTFLKVIYENFYKVYNAKAADRLGVVYTPNEIVRFMIEGTDWLCEKHFGKNLIDKDVDILDPATGTGTFTPDAKARASGLPPKALLRSDPAAGSITLDTETTLRGVPAEAWTYKLGNRCAIDWVLDQYKEKKPKDPTIREKFDTYRFSDYKEKVIDVLMRVTTVSVETVRITGAMKVAGR
jgi:predicted helicase